MNQNHFELRTINNKRIYLFEEHHKVLLCWAEERKKVNKPLYLLSLDYHTDTIQAFIAHLCEQHDDPTDPKLNSLSDDLKSKIDFTDSLSLQSAIRLLRHDEHIDAAIGANIIEHAFVICPNEPSTQSIEEIDYDNKLCDSIRKNLTVLEDLVAPTRPFTYEPPSNKIFVVSATCGIDCQKEIHDDECVRNLADQVIDSKYLSDKIDIMNEMSNSIGLPDIIDSQYILDIDLDYFNTLKSIQPQNAKIFYDLIKNATAITIAMESDCVRGVSLDGPDVNSQDLLKKLLQHIVIATA